MEPTDNTTEATAKRDSILAKADELINGERQDEYGDPTLVLGSIAEMWTAYVNGGTNDSGCDCHMEFNARDVCAMMIMLKLARINGKDYQEDSVIDVAGYAGLMELVES